MPFIFLQIKKVYLALLLNSAYFSAIFVSADHLLLSLGHGMQC